VAIQRVRVRLARLGPAALFSHLQQIEIIRRAFKNSLWPLSASNAKKNRIRASFGPAIAVGYESECEYVDVELNAKLDFNAAKVELEKYLSEGYAVRQIKSIPRFFPSLEQTLNAATYLITSQRLQGSEPLWEKFWKETHFMVIKKKSDREIAIDARSCVKSWKLSSDTLEMVVRFGPGRSLKPERIVQAVLGLTDEEAAMGTPACLLKIKKTQMFLEKQNGELVEP
jgi:radical SAM-linked protein